ncbi:MAG: DVU_1556 family methyltransferase [Peptococcales bacterium]
MGINLLEGILRPGGLKITEELIKICAFSPRSKILDLGCGAGVTVEYLATNSGWQVVGVDKDSVRIQEAKSRVPELNILEAYGESLPFSDAYFDGVFAECSLSVMDYNELVLKEINRVLRQGGKLAISDLYLRHGFSDRLDEANSNFKVCLTGARTYSELQNLLAVYGFRIIMWQDASKCLKEFVAQYIMAHGSLDRAWLTMDKGECEGRNCQGRVHKSKKDIGYFFLVAEKVSQA